MTAISEMQDYKRHLLEKKKIFTVYYLITKSFRRSFFAMPKEKVTRRFVSCTQGCLTAKGVLKRHREGQNNCPQLRKERIKQMNLDRNFLQ